MKRELEGSARDDWENARAPKFSRSSPLSTQLRAIGLSTSRDAAKTGEYPIIIIIQPIVTLSKYGQDALNICQPYVTVTLSLQ